VKTRNPSLDLLDDVVGHADATRIGDAFETGGRVHAIPENVAAIEYNIADIDADAEVDPCFLRHLSVSLGQPRWTSIAQRTASTALPNSASSPSPVFLTTCPRCSAIFGFTKEDRCSRSWRRSLSSRPLKRLYRATSAAKMAGEPRSKCTEAKCALPTRMALLYAYARDCRERLANGSGQPARRAPGPNAE
jgi:hypothetical protein